MSTEKLETRKSLSEMFEERKAEKVNEDYRIGEAAKALHDLQKRAEAFAAFTKSPQFTDLYRSVHQDPRNIEEGTGQLQNMLGKQQELLTKTVDDLNDYFTNLDMYQNPDSVNKDTHREDYRRWDKYKS